MEIAGKVAVITGAAGGIGAALAEALLAKGARVVITDLDAERLEATRARLADERDDDARDDAEDGIAALAGDAADEAHIAALIALAQERFGPVDIYAANAGVGVGADLGDEAAWHAGLDVNLMAHVRAARALVPGWVERGEGYFVSTASAAGLVTQLGSATYAVSKHAAVAFSEWLAVTYGAQGVRVSCLCPMGVDTNLLTETGGASAVARQAVLRSGEVLTPARVADDVLAAMAAETFLVLPHPQVLAMHQGKAADRDRWITGMQGFGASLAQDQPQG